MIVLRNFCAQKIRFNNMLDSLEVTKSTGPDNIPARVLKLVASSSYSAL